LFIDDKVDCESPKFLSKFLEVYKG